MLDTLLHARYPEFTKQNQSDFALLCSIYYLHVYLLSIVDMVFMCFGKSTNVCCQRKEIGKGQERRQNVRQVAMFAF